MTTEKTSSAPAGSSPDPWVRPGSPSPGSWAGPPPVNRWLEPHDASPAPVPVALGSGPAGRPRSPEDTQPIAVDILNAARSADTERGRWSLTDVFVGFGVLLLLSELLGYLAGSIGHASATASVWLGSGSVWLALVPTAIWAAKRHGTGNLFRDFGLKIRPIDLAIGLGLGVGMRVVSGIITLIVIRLTGQTPSGNLTAITGNGHGTVFVVSLVLASAVIAPVVEELFFRGVVLRSGLATLRRRPMSRWSRTPARARWTVIGISAGLFTLVHLSEVTGVVTGISLALTLLVVGGVNALISLTTGRLGSAVIAHMVFNAVAVIAFLAG